MKNLLTVIALTFSLCAEAQTAQNVAKLATPSAFSAFGLTEWEAWGYSDSPSITSTAKQILLYDY